MEGKAYNVDIIINSCLERILNGQESLNSILAEYPDQADALRPELEAAIWLASLRPALDPRPGFMAASRRRLVGQIMQKRSPTLAPVQGLAQFFQKKLVFQASLGFLLVMVLLTGNILTAAAQQTLPGNFLYPLKTLSEDARLAFSFIPASQARLRIEFARRRINEVEALAQEGQYRAASDTLTGFDYQMSQSVALLDGLAQTDPAQARELAVLINRLIDDQAVVKLLIMASAPDTNKPDLDAAVHSSTDRMADLRDELLDLAVNPTPAAPDHSPVPSNTATASLVTSPSAQPDRKRATSTSTPNPTRTSRPSNTPKPTLRMNSPTSRPSNTPRLTNTPRPSNTHQPTNTRKPPKTDSATPTQKPTKTKKP